MKIKKPRNTGLTADNVKGIKGTLNCWFTADANKAGPSPLGMLPPVESLRLLLPDC